MSKSNSDECNGVTPRLKQGQWVQSTYTFVDESMDNQPPWFFLRDAQDLFDDGAPNECVAVAASRSTDNFSIPDNFYLGLAAADVEDGDWEHHDRFDALVECLTNWDASTDPELFAHELGTSPRFAFIPQIFEDNLYKVDYVHIEGFLPVYMYRMYTSVNGTMCEPADGRSTEFRIHDAGQEHSCGGNNANANVDRLASIILACGMVPDTLCNKETGIPVQAGLDIYEFRLVK